MTRQQLPLYAIALVILVGGLALADVPWQMILIGLLALACPAMHFIVHGGNGGHGGNAGSDQDTDRPGEHQHGPTAGPR